MAGPRELSAKSLPAFLKLIESAQKKSGRSMWFRGTGLASYSLLPTLFRHPIKKDVVDALELERQLMSRFRQRSIPYHARDLRDEWDALFFMQHYGVPTRLLDWTENPFIALHFALMSARRGASGRGAYTTPAAVWMLDPVQWNSQALKHLSYGGQPLSPGDEVLKGYAPSSISPNGVRHPVALHGAHNSSRIVAQQGVFTIFGADRTAMEAADWATNTGVLSRISIAPTSLESMRTSLLNHGITESVVFPDLDGLARETKRHFGFAL